MSISRVEIHTGMYKEFQRWLQEEMDDQVHSMTARFSSCISICPARRDAKEKYISVLVPISINCGEALPTLDNCRFTFVAFSMKMSDANATRISWLKKKAFEALLFNLKDAPPDAALTLIESALSEDSTSGNRILRDIIAAYRRKKDKRDKTIYDERSTEPWNKGVITVSFAKNRWMVSSPPKTIRPSLQALKRYCTKLHKHFYSLFALNSDTSQDGLLPPHMGWVDFGTVSQYCGTAIYNAGHPGMMAEHKCRLCPSDSDVERSHMPSLASILSLAPHEVTIPLFSYALFSVLKYFFPEYPARLSDGERYRTVRRKLDKVIFMDVTGKRARELSRFFCGTFMEYENGFHPATYRKPKTPEAKRIHDGIVIYESDDAPVPRKIAEARLDHLLIQDGCALFLDAELPQRKGRITVCVPQGAQVFDVPTSDFPMATLLRRFAHHIAANFKEHQKNICKKCFHEIDQCFLKCYKRMRFLTPAGSKLMSDGDLEDMPNKKKYKRIANKAQEGRICSFREILIPFCKHFSKADEKLIKRDNSFPEPSELEEFSIEAKQIVCAKSAKYTFMPSIDQGTPTYAAYGYAEFILGASAIYRKYFAKKFLPKLGYNSALKQLKDAGHVDQQAAKNYAYLLASFRFFTDWWTNFAPEDVAKLNEAATATFIQLSKRRNPSGDVDTVQKLFFDYLSTEIAQRRIAAVREELPSKETPTGWYDPDKELIYLPYNRYFDEFRTFCVSTRGKPSLYTKSQFQEQVLYPAGLIAPKLNGFTSGYLRPECKIVVAPMTAGPSAPETVIKILLGKVMLSKSAREALAKMSQQKRFRRAPSKKGGGDN